MKLNYSSLTLLFPLFLCSSVVTGAPTAPPENQATKGFFSRHILYLTKSLPSDVALDWDDFKVFESIDRPVRPFHFLPGSWDAELPAGSDLLLLQNPSAPNNAWSGEGALLLECYRDPILGDGQEVPEEPASELAPITPSQVIPEPMTLILLTAGGLLMLGRKRKSR